MNLDTLTKAQAMGSRYNLLLGRLMFLLNRPSENLVREFITRQKDASFSYKETGASKTGAPTGYNVDHNRIQLGSGAGTYALAIKAIQSWQMFNLGWVQLYF